MKLRLIDVKIAFYCPNKPLSHPNPSGDLVIAQGLIRSLRALGCTCTEMSRFRSRWFWCSRAGWLDGAAALASAFRNAAAFRPDVWLTYHTYHKSPDVIGPAVCGLLGIPYVLFQPMYATKWRKREKTRLGFYLNRLAIKAARHAFVNNLSDLAALERVLPGSRMTYLPPGIFPEDFVRDESAGASIRADYGIGHDETLLLSAARLRPGVKFESMAYLLRSLALLPELGASKSFKLLIAGDGPMEDELKRLADDLLPGRILFGGRIPREIMGMYYSAADLFVFPGIGESLGMVYLEAQACGLPVVALRTAASVQVVNPGVTGILTPQDNGQSLAGAVAQLIAEPETRRRMGSEGTLFIRDSRNLWKNYRVLGQMLRQMSGKKPEPCGTQS